MQLFLWIAFLHLFCGATAQQNDLPQFRPPPFEGRYSITINQNYIIGSTIFEARCIGDASNATSTLNERQVIYGISSSESYFSMNSTSGIVYLNISAHGLPGIGPFTAIIFCSYIGATGANTAQISVRYRIQNEHVPHFTHGGQRLDLWLREDHLQRKGPVVEYLNITDDDLDPCNIVTFEILSGNTDATFTIGSQSGVLTLNRALDYETNQKYNLTIRATNTQCGSRQYSVQTIVCIYVEDIDDERPTFRQHLYNFSFMEEQMPRPTNFVQLRCSDADTPDARIVYEEGFLREENPFEIDHQTGNISATQALNYEQQAFYNLTFTCYDVLNQNSRDTAVVIVYVIPVNEHLPEVRLNSSFLHLNYNLPVGTLLASAANNSRAPIRITVSDRDKGLDHGRVQFSLQETDYYSYFHIDRDSGDLTLIHSFDFDVCPGSNSVSFITLRIVACDRPQDLITCPSLALTVVIIVPPEVCILTFQENNYLVNVSESRRNGSELLQVHCEIPGKRSASHQNSIGIFSPNSQFSQTLRMEGSRVILQEPLDYELFQQFVVYLRCRNIDGQESNATLTVIILPENDNSPYFKQSLYTFRTTIKDVFPETIGYITAIDEDQGTTNKLTYTLTQNQDFDSTNDVSQHFIIDTTENGTVVIDILSSPKEDTIVFDINVSDGVSSAKSIVLVDINRANSQGCLVNAEQCGTICVVLLVILIIFILSTTVIITVVCVRLFYASKRKLQDRPVTMMELQEMEGYTSIQQNSYRQKDGAIDQMYLGPMVAACAQGEGNGKLSNDEKHASGEYNYISIQGHQFHRSTSSPASRLLRQKTVSANEDMDEYIKMQLSPEPAELLPVDGSCNHKQDGMEGSSSQVKEDPFNGLDQDVTLGERTVENIYERIQ